MVVPSPPFPPGRPITRPEMEPLSKESLRRAALDARKAFVRTLSDAERDPARAAARRASHLAVRRLLRWSAAMPRSGRRSARCRRWRKRARSGRSSPSLPSTTPPSHSASAPATRSSPVRSGSCSPSEAAPVVEPDLILVPLDRDRRSRHPPRPRQGPLRPRARPAEEERRTPDRRRLDVADADRHHPGRRLGRAARRLRVARRPHNVQLLTTISSLPRGKMPARKRLTHGSKYETA